MTFHKIIPSKQSEDGSFLLDVPINRVDIPDWLSSKAHREGFRAKFEYRVTVIGIDLAHKINELGLGDEVRSLISTFSWTFNSETRYIELAKDDENNIHRQSIICMVNVPELDLFFKELENIMCFAIERPPAHITLFTKNYDRGTGLYSIEDLNRFRVGELSEEL